MTTSKERSTVRSWYVVITGDRCAYCGNRADTEEHVTPVSIMSRLAELGVAQESFIVPACLECNDLAGNCMFTTFDERRSHVRKRLQNRNETLLATNYVFDEIIHESNNSIIEKVERLRARSALRDRLFYQHSYSLEIPKPISDWNYSCPTCNNSITYKAKDAYEYAVRSNRQCSACNKKRKTPCTCMCDECGNCINHTSELSCAQCKASSRFKCKSCHVRSVGTAGIALRWQRHKQEKQ